MRLRSLEAEIDEVKMTLGDEMDTLKNDLKELLRKHEAMSFELKELNKTEQKLVLENEGSFLLCFCLVRGDSSVLLILLQASKTILP